MFNNAQGLSLGVAHASVRLDLSQLRADFQQARTTFADGIASIGRSVSGFGQALEGAGAALAPLSLGLGAIGATSLNVAGDFQQLINQIGVFGGIAGEDLERVRQAALQMGADTMFSSSDAAAGLLDMMKAGLSVEEALAAIRPTLDLAAAGNLSLAQASGIVTSSLAQFRLRSEDAARVSNALARAANASRADVAGLGQALGNVGPIAAQFGMSFEDTSAALAIFANNGIMGAEAGTQLRSMLMNMSESTATTRNAWAELGVAMYNSDGSARDFNTVLIEMDAALDRLPLEEQNRLMQALGGSYGIIGLNALRSAGGLDDMRAAMAQSADAASVGSALMQGFNGQMESLLGSVEALRIEAFTPFMEQTLTPFIAQVIEVANALTAWVRANPELVQQIIRIGAAVTAAAPTLMLVGRAIALIASPIGLVTAGLTALYLAFENNFMGIRDLVMPILEGIQTWFENMDWAALGQGIQDAFGSVMEGVQGFAGGVQQGLQELSTAAQPAVTEFQGLLGDLGVFLGELWTTVQPSLQALANWFVQDALPAAFAFVRDVALPALREFIAGLRNVWQQTAPYLIGLADWFINTALPAVVAFVRDVVIPRIRDFVTLLSGIWNAVSESLGRVYNWFVEDALPAIRDFIENEVIPKIEFFRDVLEGLWRVVQPELQRLMDWFTVNGLPVIQGAITTVTQLWDLLRTGLINLWAAAQPHLQNIYNWFRDTFQRIVDFIRPVTDAIANIVAQAQRTLDMLARIGGWQPPAQPRSVGPTFAPTGEGFLPTSYFNPYDNSRRPVSGMRDSGGRGLPGMQYLIGTRAQPELFVPDQPGTFVPNAGGEMGGVKIESLTIHANSVGEGRAAADAFEERLRELRRGKG